MAGSEGDRDCKTPLVCQGSSNPLEKMMLLEAVRLNLPECVLNTETDTDHHNSPSKLNFRPVGPQFDAKLLLAGEDVCCLIPHGVWEPHATL